MASSISTDQVLEAAQGLDKPEFTRNDVAGKLGVKPKDIKDGFKDARQSGRLEKVREDDEGKGQFRLTSAS
jgi:predicted transcriptional regulator